jgi:hypothetical protein
VYYIKKYDTRSRCASAQIAEKSKLSGKAIEEKLQKRKRMGKENQTKVKMRIRAKEEKRRGITVDQYSDRSHMKKKKEKSRQRNKK